MAHRWYPWSDGLGAEQLGGALAGAGLTPHDVDDATVAVAAMLEQLQQPGPALLRRLPPPDRSWLHRLRPSDLSAAFFQAVSARESLGPRYDRHGMTLAIDANRLTGRHARRDWFEHVRQALLRPWEVDFVVLHSPIDVDPTWSWPLRIGVLTRDPDLGGFEELLDHRWYGQLFHLATADTRPQRFDLLLVDGDRYAGLDLLDHTRADADVVVLTGGAHDHLPAEVQALFEARRLAEAALSARVVVPDERHEWLERLIEELAHAAPVHAALAMTSERLGHTPPLILGDRDVMHDLDLLGGATRFLDRALRAPRIGQALGAAAMSLNQAPLYLAMTPETAPADVADRLARELEELEFDSERMGATTIGVAAGLLSSALRAMSRHEASVEMACVDSGDAPDGATTRSRLLRARVSQADEPVLEGELRPDTDYAIEVSIGAARPDWLLPDFPFADPDVPPDSPDGWRLRVVLWEPHWLPEPVEEPLWLPVSGESRTLLFPFRTGPESADLGARVTVLHGNRVLQTGLLTGRGGHFEWTVDACPEPHLADLDSDRWYGASIVLNCDVDAHPTATTVQDGFLGVAALPMDTFDDFTARVAAELGKIAGTPEAFDSLDSDSTLELLVSLAQSGFNMLRALVKGTQLDGDQLSAASRLQIVSTHAHTFFPAEFLYAFPAPKPGARLCPGARAALESTSGRCSHTHTRDHVCPTGFWSLSKVIERHAHAPGNTQLPGPFSLLARKTAPPGLQLRPLREVLYAAAEIANEFDPDAADDLGDAAKAVAGHYSRVYDWANWEQHVQDDKPSMLLLMPHHFGTDKLRIGDTADLTLVVDETVRAADAPDHPLVLLMGCKTLLTHQAFNDHVQNFLWSGASAVVATYGTILGRHASPATVQLIQELHGRLDQGSPRLGSVLLHVKRRMLASGKPMILGVTTHGDADIQLQSNPP